jgi:hypothetical protein
MRAPVEIVAHHGTVTAPSRHHHGAVTAWSRHHRA